MPIGTLASSPWSDPRVCGADGGSRAQMDPCEERPTRAWRVPADPVTKYAVDRVIRACVELTGLVRGFEAIDQIGP